MCCCAPPFVASLSSPRTHPSTSDVYSALADSLSCNIIINPRRTMAHAQFLAEPDGNTSEHSLELRNVRLRSTTNGSDQITMIGDLQATPDHRPPSSTSTHAKACTQCGATRTPQWREGPLGPKTLCNACGVKQFRLNKRARDDGTKRRTPTPTKRKATDAAPKPPRARPAGHDWLLEAARMAQESLLKHADTDRAEHRRPPRKAAAKALLKSLEWAHGGEWVEAPRSMSDTSATSGITAQASDRAEEVAFEPRRPGSVAQQAALFGRDTQAAVDLLTLCHSEVQPADIGLLDHLPLLDEAMDADELARVVSLSLPTSLPAALLDGVAAARDDMVAAFRAKEQADLAVRTVAKVGWLSFSTIAVNHNPQSQMLAHKQSEARAQQQRVRASIAHFHAALQDIDLHCEQS